MTAERSKDNLYPEVEERLLSLAEELPEPQPGDWLAGHFEPGQTFAEYLGANPVRRGAPGQSHLNFLGFPRE